MTFDALIMAAGRGSRLGSATDERPKSLVDIGGTSPLELQLDLLAERGVSRVVVVTGYQHTMVSDAVAKSAMTRFDRTIVWNPFWGVTNVLGSAWMAREHLDRAFVYLHGDTVFEASILDDLLAGGDSPLLPIDVRACEPEQMKARVVDGVVKRLSKELRATDTTGEFIGIAYFPESAVRALIDGMDAVLARGGIQSYFEEAINWASQHRGMQPRAIETRGRLWTEIDFPEDLAFARQILPRLGQ